MPITREYLEQELTALLEQERKAFASFNAILGARQEVQKLLAVSAHQQETDGTEEPNTSAV